MKKITIREHGTNDIVKSIDVTTKSERQIDRIEDGININLDHDLFYTDIEEL